MCEIDTYPIIFNVIQNMHSEALFTLRSQFTGTWGTYSQKTWISSGSSLLVVCQRSLLVVVLWNALLLTESCFQLSTHSIVLPMTGFIFYLKYYPLCSLPITLFPSSHLEEGEQKKSKQPLTQPESPAFVYPLDNFQFCSKFT